MTLGWGGVDYTYGGEKNTGCYRPSTLSSTHFDIAKKEAHARPNVVIDLAAPCRFDLPKND
jgi:hypothetical protein